VTDELRERVWKEPAVLYFSGFCGTNRMSDLEELVRLVQLCLIFVIKSPYLQLIIGDNG
jgi:hypothetical protein